MRARNGKYGFDLLIDQALQPLTVRLELLMAHYEKSGDGDSPIERLIYAALHAFCLHEPSLGSWELCLEQRDHPDDTAGFERRLYVTPQAELEGIGRVDFLIRVYGAWTVNEGFGVAGWRHLIIECDGHNFHERTKEQAAKDRQRDRTAVTSGFDVFRFTGSEIWRDPWGCAAQIIDWADRGV